MTTKTRLTNKDICLTYTNFQNTCGFIDHAKLLDIIKNLGYPLDAIEIVGNLYKTSTTTFTGTYFGTTTPVKLSTEPYRETLSAHTYS